MTTRAERAARALLAESRIRVQPVPVERLAQSLARLKFEPFEGNISGMLFRHADGSDPVIGVNSSHTATRQRFTIGHELAHLQLHRGREVILDRVVRVDYRDDRSSRATDAEEIEANKFAAELLMPDKWVREAVLDARAMTDPDDLVRHLAERFDVSIQAMDYRLTNLGIRQHL